MSDYHFCFLVLSGEPRKDSFVFIYIDKMNLRFIDISFNEHNSKEGRTETYKSFQKKQNTKYKNIKMMNLKKFLYRLIIINDIDCVNQSKF